MKKCPGCSYLVPTEWDECRRCGASLREAAPAAPVAAPLPPASAPRPAPPPPIASPRLPERPPWEPLEKPKSGSWALKSPGHRWVYGILVVAAVIAYRTYINPYKLDVYSHSSQEAFVSGCMGYGATENSCRCEFDWMKHNVPAADFKAYVNQISSPGYTASAAPPWVRQAAEACFPASNRGVPT